MVKLVILPPHLRGKQAANRARQVHPTARRAAPSVIDGGDGPNARAAAASSYAERGWAVLPVHSIKRGVCTCSAGAECQSPGKHPILDGGVNAASKDVEQVATWWREYPDANVGIAMGKVSGLFALDVDPRHGGRESSIALSQELGKTPFSIRSDTGGGGYHRFFAYPAAGIPTRRRLPGSPGIDVQSDGTFVVAPPSRHVSGECYAWSESRDPASANVADLSEKWLAFLRNGPKPAPAPQPKLSEHAVIEGQRNTHLTSRAGTLRQAGLSPDAILAALQVENAERCQPPLADDEVAKIAGSVGRYPAGHNENQDEAELVVSAVLDQHFAGGAHLLVPADDLLWGFDGTRWSPVAKKVLRGHVLQAIRGLPPRRGRNVAGVMEQAVKLIEAQVARAGDPLRFVSEPLPVINCRNGELWIGAEGTTELRPHAPTSYLRHRLEVDYDPTATCPRYDAAVRDIFDAASDPEAMVNFWHELMGYAMQPDRRTPLVVLGYGKGNNGKTRLLGTYTRLIGHDLVMAMPIGDLEKNRFITASLLGKLAIIDDDVNSGTRLPDGHLKRLSEEKTVTGEHKYGPSFTFTSRTAIFTLFNNPPSLADLSHGMQRRLIAVPFDRSFAPEEDDKGLFQAIWATEMSGILNRYIAGLQRLIRRDWSFAPPAASMAAKASLLKAANPVPAFIDECCEREGAAYVQPLYDAYRTWADAAGIKYQQQRLSFQRNLESLGFDVRHGENGPKLHGLRLNPDRPQLRAAGDRRSHWPARPQP